MAPTSRIAGSSASCTHHAAPPHRAAHLLDPDAVQRLPQPGERRPVLGRHLPARVHHVGQLAPGGAPRAGPVIDQAELPHVTACMLACFTDHGRRQALAGQDVCLDVVELDPLERVRRLAVAASH